MVRKTNTKIVITSTWRRSVKGLAVLLNVLKEYGLAQEVIGYTPILGTKRGIEIQQFLANFKEHPDFIIIDDDCDMGDFLPYLVNTNPQFGLSAENVDECIKKLSKK